MTNEQWVVVKNQFEILNEALPAEQASALAQIDDEIVRHELEMLLKNSGGEGDTFLAAIGEAASQTFNDRDCDRRIGPYKLVQRIGQGGQGSVFEAVRDDGTFHQRVAIKIIKWELDNDIARERFRQERQILAGLEHPYIARLLDGGQSDDDVPYLVMEFVEGQPLTKAADDWPVKQKLELFLKVCQALAYAHRNLVIHRDLKPANILVNEAGDPKVLDFGIAKLIDPGASKTQTGLAALTPDYASPEQVRGQAISTASDVYSLGVVLYQLLTHRKPYTVDTTSPLEMDRVICEQPPMPPGLGDELDYILLMALRKEPERRYPSVERFAEDIERYLTLRPVLARPDSPWYRASKFIRRQRTGLIWASVALAALLIGTVQAVRAGWRADAEAASAKEINAFLENDLLAQASGYQQPDPNISVKTALDRASERIGARFSRQPRVEVSLRRTIAKTYSELGLYPEARRHVDRAVELDQRDLGPDARSTLADKTELGRLDRLQAHLPEGEARLKDVLARQQRQFGPGDASVLDTMDNLGLLQLDMGKLNDAQLVLESAAAMRTRMSGAEARETLQTLSNLGLVYNAQGKYQQGEELNHHLIDSFKRVFGPEHPETLTLFNNEASSLELLGKYDQAEVLYQQTVDIKRRILGREHPETLEAIHNLTNAQQYQGKYLEGLANYQELFKLRVKVLGPDHQETLMTQHNLTSAYHMVGNDAQALQLGTELLARSRRVLGPSHPTTLLAGDQIGMAQTALGHYAEAEALFKQGLEIRGRSLGPLHPEQLTSRNRLSALYRKQGKYAQAETLQIEVMDGLRQAVGDQHPNFMTSRVNLAFIKHFLHQDAAAEELLRSVLPGYRQRLPTNWQRFRCESILGQVLAVQGKYAEAEPLLASGYKGLAERRNRMPAESQFNIDNARQWLDALRTPTKTP